MTARFVLSERQHFNDYFVQVNPITARRSLFDQRANARDHFARTITVFDNTLYCLSPFRQVWRCSGKPAQAGITIRNDGREWLVYFMSDRSGQLAESHDASNVC